MLGLEDLLSLSMVSLCELVGAAYDILHGMGVSLLIERDLMSWEKSCEL